MNDDQLHELLYQALESEEGGVQVYETALRCVKNDDLREEWEQYREQTAHHVDLVENVLGVFGLDPTVETPGRKVVRQIGASLVKAMEMALTEGSPESAELVATECVTLAETKDHLNWELLGRDGLADQGRQGNGASFGHKGSGGAGGRAPVPHDRLEPGAVARVPGSPVGLAAPRGAEGREDRHRRGAGEEGPFRHDVICR